jgi:hypothetical protein
MAMMISKGINNIDVDIPNDAYDIGNGMPTFRAYLIAIVRDSTGKVIKVHKQRSHSPTANFIGFFLPITWYNGSGASYTITNTGGGTCSYKPGLGNNYQSISYPNNSYNVPTYFVMIQVGSGSNSNPFSATQLAAPISSGTGSGQLAYGPFSLSTAIVINGNSAYVYISQTYSNTSGATINITEVGIIVYIQTVQAGGGGTTNCGQVLLWYDVLSSPISVPNNGSVTIYYTFIVNP